jgi:hypothetical protein
MPKLFAAAKRYCRVGNVGAEFVIAPIGKNAGKMRCPAGRGLEAGYDIVGRLQLCN